MKRNLSGVFILEEDEPTCFEDCSEKIQDEWLDSLEPEAVENLAKHLAKTLKEIGDFYNIEL